MVVTRHSPLHPAALWGRQELVEFLPQVGPKGWGVGRPRGLDGEKDTQERVRKLPFPPGYWDPKQG